MMIMMMMMIDDIIITRCYIFIAKAIKYNVYAESHLAVLDNVIRVRAINLNL